MARNPTVGMFVGDAEIERRVIQFAANRKLIVKDLFLLLCGVNPIAKRLEQSALFYHLEVTFSSGEIR